MVFEYRDVFSESQMELWGTDLSGGILVQEEDYRAYDNRPRMANVASTRQPQRPRPFHRGLSLQTMPTLNPQDAYAAAMMHDSEHFDTGKVAGNGTLKRRQQTEYTVMQSAAAAAEEEATCGLPLLQTPQKPPIGSGE